MNRLARDWRIVALRGALGIVAGGIAIVLPGITLTALVIVFGAYAFADGIALLYTGFRQRGKEKRWWSLVLQGIAGVAAGVITLFVPLATALALLAVVAAWAILSGVFEIAAAVRLRREIKGEWLLGLLGVLSVLLGVALVALPGAGLVALAWMLGFYLISSGAALLALAFRLRRHGGEGEAMRVRPSPA